MQNKRKKKVQKKRQGSLFFSGNIWTGIVAFFVVLLTTIFLFQAYSASRIRSEATTEEHALPPDIKEQIKKATPSANFRIPILMYHYVEYIKDTKDKTRVSLNTPPYIFEEQLKTLKQAGYTFITAKDIADIIDGNRLAPKKPIAITIDDGHWDLATDILPLLKQYNVKVTAYIIPGFIGGSDFLSEEQLHEVATSGLVEIGAHTVHHVYLKGMNEEEAKKEITESKMLLEQDLHIPIVSFAYPYGAFDTQAADLVKQAGFREGVSTVPGIDVSQVNRYFLFRLRAGDRVDQELLNFLDQTSFSP